ncbi:MAG: tRNA (adenosine(37)-N6)-threonylcarbamoyltransferase complex dimerization subunit type 1 TsaB [Alphaproteobacteria bacterium]|nr:tRNA (adenosine(37)-N6)-threonylcarbamoyltransferase complex dimerization subunit type 1 TsaB [Alphaproteobacteria bacterium]
MYTLAFDTTAGGCNIALLQENRVIDCFKEQMEFGQAEVLVPQISEMLRAQKLEFKQLDLLGVCVGPGSFTGVRSSVAAARAFALASPQIAVTGVTAFEAYAHSLDMSELSSLNAVIIETKRDDFYVQLFNGRLEKLTDAAALTYEDILPQLKGRAVTLIGDGVERFLDKPSGLVLHSIRMDKSASITDIAACAIEKYKSHKLNYPKPMYLRAPDVCVKS